jgi:hypothetical protein
MSQCTRERCDDGDFNFISDVGSQRESVELPTEDACLLGAFGIVSDGGDTVLRVDRRDAPVAKNSERSG